MSGSKQSPRQFECPDDIWQKLEQMAAELEVRPESLVTMAIRQMLRRNEHAPTPIASPGPCLSIAPRFDQERPDPPLVVRAGGVDYLVRDAPLVIGASEECGLVLVGDEVAAVHARIERTRGAYFVVDLGAPSGVIWNGHRIDRKAIASGDEIMIGGHRLTFRFVG